MAGERGKASKKGGFIMQAGILAAAGILCRIIGLLYRSPLTGIIGNEGNGYYSSAYNIYSIILLISSYSIPSAISKVIARKLALEEYRNAHRIFICSVYYVVVIGGAASILLFFGAGLFVEGNAVTVLRVFAPTIFLYGLLGVLRGYFQAHGTMLQTSVSQILEQILNAAVSLGAAYMLIQVMMGRLDPNAMTSVEWNSTRAVYGAAGSALGTGVGVLTALIFMWFIYLLNRKIIYRRIRRDHTSHVDSYRDILRMVVGIVTPFILSTAIYNLSTSLNQTIYVKIMKYVKDVAEAELYTMYGIFAGKAVVISNIPIAMASAMSSAILPSVATLYAKKQIQETRIKVGEAIHTTMLISIPSAVGLCVLAKPITMLLFPQKEYLDLAANLLSALAVSVVFYALSTLTNAVLQGIGRVNVPVVNAAGALIIQTVVLVILVLFTDLNLYSLVIANIVYSACMCMLNGSAMRKYMRYKQEMKKTFIMPFLAAALMGAAARGIYEGMHMLTSSNTISLVISIGVAVIIYFVFVIKLGSVNEEDLKRLPKGALIVRIAKKCRLL